MRPVDIAKTAILATLINDREPQDEAQLIKAVNAHAPGSPSVAMEPAKNELLGDGHLEQVKIGVRQGFFTSERTAFKLTASGEALAYAVQGTDIEELKAAAALKLLAAAENKGFILRDHLQIEGIGSATARGVFDQLCEDGLLRAGQKQGSLFSFPAGYPTQKGAEKLATMRSSAAPAAS